MIFVRGVIVFMSLETRKRIAKAFKKLVYQDGFKHTTVSKIMKVCKMRRQTFYEYFYDKYDLLDWTLNYILEENVDENLNYLSWEEIIRLTFYEIDVNAKFYRDIFCTQNEVDLTKIIAYHFQILLFHLLEKSDLMQNKSVKAYVETSCLGIAATITHNLITKQPQEYDVLAEKVIQAVKFSLK